MTGCAHKQNVNSLPGLYHITDSVLVFLDVEESFGSYGKNIVSSP